MERWDHSAQGQGAGQAIFWESSSRFAINWSVYNQKASNFFRISAMWAVFSKFQCWPLTANSWLRALRRSNLIVLQHFLKNKPIEPTGPGAFSEGISLMATLSSSMVKGGSQWLRFALGSCRKSPSSWKGLPSLVPSSKQKWLRSTSALSLWSDTTEVPEWRKGIWFLRRRPFARRWDNFVFPSPALSWVYMIDTDFQLCSKSNSAL